MVVVLLLRWLFYSLVDMAQLKRRILVLGAGQRAKGIFDNISKESFIGSEIVGFVPSDQEASEAMAGRSRSSDSESKVNDMIENEDWGGVLKEQNKEARRQVDRSVPQPPGRQTS